MSKPNINKSRTDADSTIKLVIVVKGNREEHIYENQLDSYLRSGWMQYDPKTKKILTNSDIVKDLYTFEEYDILRKEKDKTIAELTKRIEELESSLKE